MCILTRLEKEKYLVSVISLVTENYIWLMTKLNEEKNGIDCKKMYSEKILEESKNNEIVYVFDG